MADIQIDDPINLAMDIQEFDENLPSLKLNCILNNKSIKGNFNIEFNFWVFCQDFDSFKKGQISFLNDLSGIKRLFFENEKLIINPSFKSPIFNFDCKTIFEISQYSKQNFLAKLAEFENWW